jgi:hypothetical protein
VSASADQEWELTLALHDAGLPFCVYRRAENFLLSRPGLRRTPRPEVGHIKISLDDLRRMLGSSPEEIEPLSEREDLMLGFWD